MSMPAAKKARVIAEQERRMGGFLPWPGQVLCSSDRRSQVTHWNKTRVSAPQRAVVLDIIKARRRDWSKPSEQLFWS